MKTKSTLLNKYTNNFFVHTSKECGITLVALIITIVVLIILAAVTIKTLVDSNFIETASKGAENYVNAQKYEERIMDNIAEITNKVVANIISGTTGKEPEKVNNAPKIISENTTVYTNYIYLSVTAEDDDGDELTYKLYWGTDADNLVEDIASKTIGKSRRNSRNTKNRIE